MLLYDTKREQKEKRDLLVHGKRNEVTKAAPERMLPYDSIRVTQLFSPRIETGNGKKVGQVNCDRVCQLVKNTEGHLVYDLEYVPEKREPNEPQLENGTKYSSGEIETFNKMKKGTKKFANKPLIVFETFGPNVDQLLNIYRQSMQYQGDTLCILGINAENANAESYNNVRVLARQLVENLNVTQNGNMQHKFKVVPFVWSTPKGAADQYYKVPYFEVRKLLMKVAADMTGEVNNVVYRWIDRDVTNDTSVSNSPQTDSILRDLANSSMDGSDKVITGIYNWGYVARGNYNDKWNQFFNDMTSELNSVETQLRSYFFTLYKLCGSGSFYMPEPVLFTGKNAHNKAITSLTRRIGEVDEKKQDGESKAAISEEQIKKTRVVFSKHISVSKPVKLMDVRETIGGREVVKKQSYLHTLEKYFLDKLNNEKDFHIALTNTRQTAFNNSFWNFISVSPYDKWYNLGKIETQAKEDSKKPENNVQIINAQLKLSRRRSELGHYLFKKLNAIRPQ